MKGFDRMNEQYKDLVRYAEILNDKNFDFPEDDIYIRMTVFLYENKKYLTICKNGECVSVETI